MLHCALVSTWSWGRQMTRPSAQSRPHLLGTVMFWQIPMQCAWRTSQLERKSPFGPWLCHVGAMGRFQGPGPLLTSSRNRHNWRGFPWLPGLQLAGGKVWQNSGGKQPAGNGSLQAWPAGACALPSIVSVGRSRSHRWATWCSARVIVHPAILCMHLSGGLSCGSFVSLTPASIPLVGSPPHLLILVICPLIGLASSRGPSTVQPGR